MGLLIPTSTTVTLAAGASSGTFNGGDISAIKSGMALNPGSYDGESGVSRVLLSVTPAGNGIGGTFTIKGSFPAASTASPFVVDPKGGDGAYATFLVVRIYNILMTWIGGVVLDAPSKTVRLDRGVAGSGSFGRYLFSILGRDWFAMSHVTSGGEKLRITARPDGTTDTGGLEIDGATGQVAFPAGISAVVSGNLGGVSASSGYTIGSDPLASITAGSYIQFLGSARAGLPSTLVFGSGNNNVILQGEYLRPFNDAGINFGHPSFRVGTYYGVVGAINTSDGREKTPVAPLTEAEIAAASALAREIGTFQFLSSIAEKGAAAARHHVGMTVQRAIEIMQAHGLDPFRFGLICHDAWAAEAEVPATEDAPGMPARAAGDRYGFREGQLALFIGRGHEARLAALEARLAG